LKSGRPRRQQRPARRTPPGTDGTSGRVRRRATREPRLQTRGPATAPAGTDRC
jgi:hypothetical protein